MIKSPNPELFYYVYSKLNSSERWSVQKRDILHCLETNKNMFLINPWDLTQFNTIALFQLDLYKEVEDEIVEIPYYDDDVFILPFSDLEKKMMLKFHYTWYNLMHSYIVSPEFMDILKKVREERIAHKLDVFPDIDFVFNCFSQDVRDLKAVWLGLSPYPHKLHANGYAFSTYEKQKPASLKVIENAIKKAYKMPFNWSLQNDLIHLVQQGVFLYNIALTTPKIDAKAHITIWKPFTDKVLSILAQNNLVWLVFGADAAKLVPKEINAIFVKHPAWYARIEQEMPSQGFEQFKNLLPEITL